jgi:hypothetical protein
MHELLHARASAQCPLSALGGDLNQHGTNGRLCAKLMDEPHLIEPRTVPDDNPLVQDPDL